MSMNLHLEASIEAFSKIGKHTLRHTFDLWQTPTQVTKKAIRGGHPKDVYIEWLNELQTKDIVDVESLKNRVKHHIEELNNWLIMHKQWNIEWFEL